MIPRGNALSANRFYLGRACLCLESNFKPKRNKTVNEIPRYKQEIQSSGLSQKEWYHQIYLKSDHWKSLKHAKVKEVGRKCEVCGSTKKLEFHHDKYRDIYDVTTGDLRILCKTHHHEFHFGENKKKDREFDIDSINLDSPNLENQLLALISNLKKSLRNQSLNIVIKAMRKKGMSQMVINPIIALKSGKKARMLRLSMNGGKWRTEDFDYNWKKFSKGKQVTRLLIDEFRSVFRANLRTRHIRKLNSMEAHL